MGSHCLVENFQLIFSAQRVNTTYDNTTTVLVEVFQNGRTMVYWGDDNLSRWSDFCPLFNQLNLSQSLSNHCPIYLPSPPIPPCPPPPPPPGWLYELEKETVKEPRCTIQVVSFKKNRMKTIRRLEITDSRRKSGTTFCWIWVRGSVRSFRWPHFYRKNHYQGMLWKKCCSRPPDPSMKLIWCDQRSKFGLDSSSNESIIWVWAYLVRRSQLTAMLVYN